MVLIAENEGGCSEAGSGHRGSLRGANKLARRARSFKDDLLERISNMRSPAQTHNNQHLSSAFSPRRYYRIGENCRYRLKNSLILCDYKKKKKPLETLNCCALLISCGGWDIRGAGRPSAAWWKGKHSGNTSGKKSQFECSGRRNNPKKREAAHRR
ncbi:Guanine nucleotide-releasing factor 2 [Eumeta japonica]|uniref:Guanine nucleotide-releasing factor 2 n=1 Tax=Eumeta variegata TaxID=151549 RepID=A0A4C1TF98_EUMVA|nr:Guanine nucleotide-releasing factor 2 [Eumeta japonica]